MRRTFVEHEEWVKRTVPGDRLLVFEIGEGWDVLCAFLEKERPRVGWPNVNDKEAYVEGFRRARNRAVWRVMGRGAVVVVGVVAVVGAWYWGL